MPFPTTCRLKELVKIGPHAPAGITGAKFIIRKDGRRINLAYLRPEASMELEVGLEACILLRASALADTSDISRVSFGWANKFCSPMCCGMH